MFLIKIAFAYYLKVSFFDNSAWFTCKTIQSNNAPYRHFAIASLLATASGNLKQYTRINKNARPMTNKQTKNY